LVVVDILLFVLFFDPQGFDSETIEGFHPHMDLGISMSSPVAVEPAERGSHLCLRTRSPSGQGPHTGL